MNINTDYKNIDLINVYNKIFSDGSENFHSFNFYEESQSLINIISDWKNKEVLEIGCGKGNLASMMSYAGAKSIYATDYSEEAISEAKSRYNLPNVIFTKENYRNIKNKYDIVVLQGVLEHFDEPFQELDFIINNLLKENGILITSSPSFINPRGYIWMTLAILFDVKMSLTDKHFICPFNFENYCQHRDYYLEYKSTYLERAAGEDTIIDYNKRLRNALKEYNIEKEKIDKLLNWLLNSVKYFTHNDATGAMVAYKIIPNKDYTPLS